MTNLLPTLHEKAILLIDNKDTSNTTTNMYIEILTTRAAIFHLGKGEYEIIIPKPPPKLEKTPFSAIRLEGIDYRYKGPFKEYRERYQRGFVQRT
ncbi:MAG: hypothetical protein LBT03_02575 [Holosporales bacterium]|jgi:hypothetical protein|nr:hypothetical protein [Holosporales bacterium]